MYGQQNVIAVHRRLSWLNVEAKYAQLLLLLLLLLLFFEVRSQLLLRGTTGYKVLTMVKNSARGLREAHTNSIFSLAISVLEYYKSVQCYLKPGFHMSRKSQTIADFCRGTQRLFSEKYLLGEANIAQNFLLLEDG